MPGRRPTNHLWIDGQYRQTMGSRRRQVHDHPDASQKVGQGIGDTSNRVQFRKCQWRWKQVSSRVSETSRARSKKLTQGNSIKKWKCPEGTFVNNFVGHEAIINTLSLNNEGVLFSGADNGTLTMWDYKTGLPFQNLKDIPQPGSLDAEAVSRQSCHIGVSVNQC